jgi:hypothetical protein
MMGFFSNRHVYKHFIAYAYFIENNISLHTILCRVFQKEFYNGIPNVTVWRVLRKPLHLKMTGRKQQSS